MSRLNKLFFIIFLLLSCSKESVKYTLNIKINPTDGGYVNISNGEFSSGEQISPNIAELIFSFFVFETTRVFLILQKLAFD